MTTLSGADGTRGASEPTPSKLQKSAADWNAVAQRFAEKTERLPSGCLLWTAGRNNTYGTFSWGGSQIQAHRAAWILATGEVLGPGDHVLHSCDFTLCVEVEHLRVGSQAENNAERAARNRSNNLRGEDHPNTKFSDADVARVRDLLANGWTIAAISQDIGCSKTTVAGIRDGKTRTRPTGTWESVQAVPRLRKWQREANAAAGRSRLAALSEVIVTPEDRLEGEEWRPTTRDGYFVSSVGRVRGPKGTILKLQNSGNGYLQLRIRGANVSVHVLVCTAFHGPRPEGMEVAHRDGVGTNNNAANLRWDTRRGNFSDKRAHGTWPTGPGLKGEANGNSKLTSEQVQEIRAVWPRPRGTQKQLAEKFGVRTTTIANVWNQKFWQDG